MTNIFAADTHIHRYFLEKEVSQVVLDLQNAGCAVEYIPGTTIHGSPKSAFFHSGSVADCSPWTDPLVPIPPTAKACVELLSRDSKTDGLVRQLYSLPPSCKNCSN